MKLGTIICIVLALLLVAGCDGLPGGSNPRDEVPPSQTEILRVEAAPDTVAVGDTARFTCVIADSTDGRFRFHWSFSTGKPAGAVTEEHTVLWEAPGEPGTYTATVKARNGTDGTPPSKQFEITVEQER